MNKEQRSQEIGTADSFIYYGPDTDVFFLHYYFVWALLFFSREVEVDLPKEDLVMIKLATYSHGYVIFYVKLLPNVTDGKLKT